MKYSAVYNISAQFSLMSRRGRLSPTPHFRNLSQDQPHFRFTIILTASYHETSIQLTIQVRQDAAKLDRVSICRLSILLSSFRSRFQVFFYGAPSFQEPVTCIIAIPFQRATKVAPDHQRQNRYLVDKHWQLLHKLIHQIQLHLTLRFNLIVRTESLRSPREPLALPRSPPNIALDSSKCLRKPIHHLDGSSRGKLSLHQPSSSPPASPDLSSQLLAEISSSYLLFPATTPVIQLLLSRHSPPVHRH